MVLTSFMSKLVETPMTGPSFLLWWQHATSGTFLVFMTSPLTPTLLFQCKYMWMHDWGHFHHLYFHWSGPSKYFFQHCYECRNHIIFWKQLFCFQPQRQKLKITSIHFPFFVIKWKSVVIVTNNEKLLFQPPPTPPRILCLCQIVIWGKFQAAHMHWCCTLWYHLPIIINHRTIHICVHSIKWSINSFVTISVTSNCITSSLTPL